MGRIERSRLPATLPDAAASRAPCVRSNSHFRRSTARSRTDRSARTAAVRTTGLRLRALAIRDERMRFRTPGIANATKPAPALARSASSSLSRQTDEWLDGRL